MATERGGQQAAALVLVGRAGHADLRDAAQVGDVVGTGMRGAVGIFLLAFPALFIMVFSSEPEFVDLAVIWLRIQAVSGMAMGSAMVFQQSFNVAGDTVGPMVISLASQWLVEIPGAFVLSRSTSLLQFGISLAMAVAMFIRLGLYLVYFVRGRWLRAEVL